MSVRLTILVCLAMPAAMPAQAQTQADAPAHQSLNGLADFDPSSLKGFIERPLFSPERSVRLEPVPIEPPVEPPPAETFNFQLLGVVTTPRGPIARIVDLDDTSSYSLRQGDSFRGWTITSINRAGVRISRDSETRELVIFAGTEPGTSTAPETTTDQLSGEPIDPNRPVRIIPGASGPPQDSSPWTEQDQIDVFGRKPNPPESP